MKYLLYDDSTTRANREANKYRESLRKAADCDVTTKWLEELRDATTHCRYCGVEMPANSCVYPHGKTKDHIIPISKGGRETKANIQYICWMCNNIKSNLLEEEFLKKMKGGEKYEQLETSSNRRNRL